MSAASVTRIRTVEGVRGLAALIVVFDHTVGSDWGIGAWTAQNHGVTVFAILAGFLLSAPFLRARLDRRAAPSARAFVRARAVRVYPGYWVALLVAALLVGLHRTGAGDILPVVTLTQTLGTDTPFEGLPPAWSLSMFLSFYLLLPVWSAWRARMTAAGVDDRSLLLTEARWLGVVIVGSWVVRTTSATDAFAAGPAFTVLGRADWFAIGMLLAVLTTARARGIRVLPSLLTPGRAPAVACSAALAATIASALIPMDMEEVRDQMDTLAAALLVAAAVLHGPVLRGPQHLLASRPAVAIGRWSYGIFLYGYIMQKVVQSAWPTVPTGTHLLLSMTGAVAAGAASWRFVERPAVAWVAQRRAKTNAGVSRSATAVRAA